jgi:Fic family protein
MNHGLRRLREGFPLSLRLIREIHEVLLAKGRGSQKEPGEFRRSQNWIGGSRPRNALFVPPPPERVMECMGALELFLHQERPELPTLVKAALAHVQFETIHPFLDGNGRLGRLLITFLLCAAGALREPILYLSLYFKSNRQRYYDLLQAVRETGDWETWLEFFLTGIRETADQAAETARRILALFEADRRKIESLGRPAASALRVHQFMQTRPIISIPAAAEKLSLSAPTVAKSIEHMIRLGLLREITGKQRHRLFVYDPYLAILNEGTEPLSLTGRDAHSREPPPVM